MLLKSNVVAKHFAISVPLHDFSHYFWSVLLQAFLFTDTLTLSSRVDRSSPTSVHFPHPLLVQQPATTILSLAVLSALLWSTTNQQSLAICCATSTPALSQACGAPHPEGPREALSQLGLVFFFPISVSTFFRGARRGRVRGGPGCE